MGFKGSLLLSQGNGGLLSAAGAAARPIATLQSGPASGAAAAHYLGLVAGHERLIALDIGGTSTDVAIIDRGLPYTTDSHVGDFPVILPLTDVSSIGAGGGSIVWVDSSGVLKVGPQSAGAAPGPACYGRGGTEATLTDAYFGAGIMSPAGFLGGTAKLDVEAANRALARVGTRIGGSAEDVAKAIIDIATSKMYAEVVRLIAKKGVDISEFGLVLYGGAGATHGFLLAKELGISEVIVPPAPGLLCALGTLTTDVKSDFIKSIHVSLTGKRRDDMAGVVGAYDELEKRAGQWLKEQNVPQNGHSFPRSADMRYQGQSYELTVTLPCGSDGTTESLSRTLLEAFHRMHERIYGHADVGAPVEIISVRVTALGKVRKPTAEELTRIWRKTQGSVAGSATKGARRIALADEDSSATVYDRLSLPADEWLSGPAVVEQYDTTTFIPRDYSFTVDAFGNILGRAATALKRGA
jgi:N-methylhydantoinase A